MLNTGDKIGGYTVTRELGRGGMGVVYLAHDPLLKRDACLKVMLPGQAAVGRRRFAREAAAIAKCGHPGIIKVYSYGEHEELPFLAMEYVDGKTLAEFHELARTIKNAGDLEVLKKYGYLNEPTPENEELPFFMRTFSASPLDSPDYESHAASLIAGVADALFEAHSQGILHRDIKPSNILIGKKGPPKLADFGLAKLSDSSDITTGQPMIGTLRYMAPEVFSGTEHSKASDIYSLGTMLYELLTLTHPFSGDSPAALIKSITQDSLRPPAALNKEISPALNLVVLRCMDKVPSARFKDARELADAIRLAARPKGLRTQILAGLKDLLAAEDKPEVTPAPEETRTAQVNAEAKAEAARLAAEAKHVYFAGFAIPEATDLILKAVKFDPYSIEANGLLVLLSYHMGMHAAVKRAIPRLRHLARHARETDLRRRAALLADRVQSTKDWLANTEKYLAEGNDDPVLLALCARARLNESGNTIARAHVRRIEKLFPGGTLFSWFIEAYHHAWTGDFDKHAELTRAAIRRFPENPMLRFALAQSLLEHGHLDEADKTLAEAGALAEHEPLFHFLRAEAAVLRKDYKTACSEQRKYIGSGADDTQSYAYYKLGKLYALRNDRKEALRHLEIARNLSPENNYKSNEELAALVDGAQDYRTNFDDLPGDCLKFNYGKAVQVLKKNLFSAINNSGESASTIYIFEPGNRPRALRCWQFFNESNLNGARFTRLYFQSPPMSSFSDHRGNVLRSELERSESAYGRYYAKVDYASALNHLESVPIEVKLDAETMCKVRHDGQIELRLEDVNQHLGFRSHIIALPGDAEILNLAAKPEEDIRKGNWRFLVYSRFFFDREHFRLNARFRYKRA